jgi:hypothetical protein
MFNSSDANITNCTFSGNTAYGNDEFNGSGGGIYNSGMSIITNCTFIGNSATGSGGAIDNFGYPTITNCTFSENSADCGGAMNNFESLAIITNCTFSGNSAIDGGGMCNNDGGPITIANCTFTGNLADANGGGMYNVNYGYRMIINCIFRGNEALNDGNEIYNRGYHPTEPIDPIFIHCDIRGYGAADSNFGPDGIVDGGGNINADPCFFEPGYWADVNDPNIPVEPNDPNAIWVEGNYRLLPISPCIDAGDPNYSDPNNTTDLDGLPRFIDGDCNDSNIVDMGAYEFEPVLAGDFDRNCRIDFFDYSILAEDWLESSDLCDIAPVPYGNGAVDIEDVAVVCKNWLYEW